MADYLLDTTVLIDYFHGRRPSVELLDRLEREGHRLGVCAVGITELYSGLTPGQRLRVDPVVDGLEYYAATPEMAKEAGRYRYEFARQGITLSAADTITAAAAIANGAILPPT